MGFRASTVQIVVERQALLEQRRQRWHFHELPLDLCVSSASPLKASSILFDVGNGNSEPVWSVVGPLHYSDLMLVSYSALARSAQPVSNLLLKLSGNQYTLRRGRVTAGFQLEHQIIDIELQVPGRHDFLEEWIPRRREHSQRIFVDEDD